MPRSTAGTVQEYLDQLPPERRDVVATVRKVILDHLPAGYHEAMGWGMITYEIPLERYPDTYNGRPLGYVALAAQKNHFALYLTCEQQSPERVARLEEAFRRAGKKLDMGKSCLRFRRLEDLPLEAIGEVVAGTPPEAFIEQYEAGRRR